MRRAVLFSATLVAFQSAPDREVGRCVDAAGRWVSDCLFQSAPDREVGRCWNAARKSCARRAFQSAPDREVGRCLGATDETKVVIGFNPRPTVRSGDARTKDQPRRGT